MIVILSPMIGLKSIRQKVETVDWNFPDSAMERKVFGPRWRKWVYFLLNFLSLLMELWLAFPPPPQ